MSEPKQVKIVLLTGYLGEEELTPREIDAATQVFVIPAGHSGDFRMTFSAQPVYRATLLFGGAVGLLTLGLCILAATRRPSQPTWRAPRGGAASAVVALGALALTGWPAAVAAVSAWLVLRWTTIPRAYLAPGVVAAAGALLARASSSRPTSTVISSSLSRKPPSRFRANTPARPSRSSATPAAR